MVGLVPLRRRCCRGIQVRAVSPQRRCLGFFCALKALENFGLVWFSMFEGGFNLAGGNGYLLCTAAVVTTIENGAVSTTSRMPRALVKEKGWKGESYTTTVLWIPFLERERETEIESSRFLAGFSLY